VTSSHYGLAVAMDSAKRQAFEVSCWASVNWRVRSVKVWWVKLSGLW